MKKSLLRHNSDQWCSLIGLPVFSTLRDNMACLLWQAANCQTHQEQQRSGEHILAAQNFLDRFCDFDGGWSQISREIQFPT